MISSLSLTFQCLVESVATMENVGSEYEYFPLGKPFENIQILLVNPDSGDIETEQGEVWISGDIVSKDSLTQRCNLNDSTLYTKTGWIMKLTDAGHLQPIEPLQQYLQTKQNMIESSVTQEEDATQVVTMDFAEPPSSLSTPPLETFSLPSVGKASSSTLSPPLPVHTKRQCLHLPLRYDDEDPGYFQVGKSTFSLAEIDFLLQLISSIDHVKSFLVNDQVHVALTLQPGTKVTAGSFTKHLHQWGIIRKGVVPVHYYVCRQWKPCTRASIKQYCLSMPQHKVKEASTESFEHKSSNQSSPTESSLQQPLSSSPRFSSPLRQEKTTSGSSSSSSWFRRLKSGESKVSNAISTSFLSWKQRLG